VYNFSHASWILEGLHQIIFKYTVEESLINNFFLRSNSIGKNFLKEDLQFKNLFNMKQKLILRPSTVLVQINSSS
jgi:hypothetical protein